MKDTAYKIALNPKYDGYQKELASKVYKIFEKIRNKTGSETSVNEELSQEGHKLVI